MSTTETYTSDVVSAPDLVSPPEVRTYCEPQVGNRLTNLIERLSDGPARQRCEFCHRLHGWRYGCDVLLALALLAVQNDLAPRISERGGRVGRAR